MSPHSRSDNKRTGHPQKLHQPSTTMSFEDIQSMLSPYMMLVDNVMDRADLESELNLSSVEGCNANDAASANDPSVSQQYLQSVNMFQDDTSTLPELNLGMSTPSLRNTQAGPCLGVTKDLFLQRPETSPFPSNAMTPFEVKPNQEMLLFTTPPPVQEDLDTPQSLLPNVSTYMQLDVLNQFSSSSVASLEVKPKEEELMFNSPRIVTKSKKKQSPTKRRRRHSRDERKIRKISGKARHPCPYCHDIDDCDRKDNMNRHIKAKHQDKITKKLLCVKCNQFQVDQSSLTRHEAHCKRYFCGPCNKAVPQNHECKS